MLLPYFAADRLGTVSGLTAAGPLPTFALAAAGVVALTGDRRETLTGLPAIAAAVAVMLAVVLTGAALIDATLAAREAQSFESGANLGSGLWLLATAAVAAVGGLIAAIGGRVS